MKTDQNLIVATRRYRKTKRGVLTNIYGKQRERRRIRGFAPPEYTLRQLHDRFLDNKKFDLLFKAWTASNYNKQLKPSVDRIDCMKGYSMGNIQILTWAENRYKQRFELKRVRARTVYCLVGSLMIAKYRSVSDAVRKTGIHQGNISSCLHNARLTAGGYRWSYQNS